ncbi:MAG: F0F1 ATP synthase subunit epsilon [Bifidobacteriaceae bacterium]|nr:F0F1 ATP synthase subunit epsilon [Bifidobacteriaceae bacterium]
MSEAIMQVAIVASNHPVWEGKATTVTVPGTEGTMGIMPNHEPVLTLISSGTVHVQDDAGKSHYFAVADGFISFDSNKLTIAVERGKSIDKPEA